MHPAFASLEEWEEALAAVDIPVIVEGPNDRKALKAVGVKDIVTLSRKPIFKIAEDLAERTKRVVILTDLDKQGRVLYGKLKQNLERLGVQIDERFREYLFQETELSQIEGLVTYLRNHID